MRARESWKRRRLALQGGRAGIETAALSARAHPREGVRRAAKKPPPCNSARATPPWITARVCLGDLGFRLVDPGSISSDHRSLAPPMGARARTPSPAACADLAELVACAQIRAEGPADRRGSQGRRKPWQRRKPRGRRKLRGWRKPWDRRKPCDRRKPWCRLNSQLHKSRGIGAGREIGDGRSAQATAAAQAMEPAHQRQCTPAPRTVPIQRLAPLA